MNTNMDLNIELVQPMAYLTQVSHQIIKLAIVHLCLRSHVEPLS